MKGRAQVFIDTSALLALASKDDALHERALEVEAESGRDHWRLVTSGWVLTEFLNAMSSPRVRMAAVAVVDDLMASERVRIVPATGGGWREALSLYRSRADKGWSLVDCASVLICRERGIQRVFTHDRHFIQAGLQILL